MADVVKQTELEDNKKHTSDSQKYDASEVVICVCKNGTPGPTQPCRATIELSADDVAWVAGGSHQFGPVEGEIYYGSFPLSQFAATGAWKHYRVMFGGNVGGAVTIAAATGQAPELKEEDKEAKGDKGAPHGGHHQPQPLKR